MNEVIMLHQIRPVGILHELMDRTIPLSMSAFCSGRWQRNRVLITDVREDAFDLKVSPRKKNRNIQVRAGQSVGIAFQYEYGQDTFIFDTEVLAIKSTQNEKEQTEMMVLAMPEQIEQVQIQSFRRVQVPAEMNVEVSLSQKNISQPGDPQPSFQTIQGFKARLIDLSADGLQIAVPRSQGPVFEKGQCLGLECVPLPGETPLRLNAYVRQIFPDAAQEHILLGMQIMGLEASPEGRMVLQRICGILEQYRQMNQSQ